MLSLATDDGVHALGAGTCALGIAVHSAATACHMRAVLSSHSQPPQMRPALLLRQTPVAEVLKQTTFGPGAAMLPRHQQWWRVACAPQCWRLLNGHCCTKRLYQAWRCARARSGGGCRCARLPLLPVMRAHSAASPATVKRHCKDNKSVQVVKYKTTSCNAALLKASTTITAALQATQAASTIRCTAKWAALIVLLTLRTKYL